MAGFTLHADFIYLFAVCVLEPVIIKERTLVSHMSVMSSISPPPLFLVEGKQ